MEFTLIYHLAPVYFKYKPTPGLFTFRCRKSPIRIVFDFISGGGTKRRRENMYKQAQLHAHARSSTNTKIARELLFLPLNRRSQIIPIDFGLFFFHFLRTYFNLDFN